MIDESAPGRVSTPPIYPGLNRAQEGHHRETDSCGATTVSREREREDYSKKRENGPWSRGQPRSADVLVPEFGPLFGAKFVERL